MKQNQEFHCRNCYKQISIEVEELDLQGMVECPQCGWWTGYDFSEEDPEKYGGPGQPLLRQVHSLVDVYSYDERRRKKLLCTFGWNSEYVTIEKEDEKRVGTQIVKKGIVARKHLHSVRLYPRDGLKFLWELKFRFNTKRVKATDIYSNPSIVDSRPAKRWKCINCGMMVYSCDRPLYKHFRKKEGECSHPFWLQVTWEGEQLETMEDISDGTIHSGRDVKN